MEIRGQKERAVGAFTSFTVLYGFLKVKLLNLINWISFLILILYYDLSNLLILQKEIPW